MPAGPDVPSNALVRLAPSIPQRDIVTATVTSRGIEARIPKNAGHQRPSTVSLLLGALAGPSSRSRKSTIRVNAEPKPGPNPMNSGEPPGWTEWNPNSYPQQAAPPPVWAHPWQQNQYQNPYPGWTEQQVNDYFNNYNTFLAANQQTQPQTSALVHPPIVQQSAAALTPVIETTPASDELVLARDISKPRIIEPLSLDLHRCAQCGNVRSSRYQRKHPLRPGQIPSQSICRKCQRDKESTVSDSTSSDSRSHHRHRSHRQNKRHHYSRRTRIDQTAQEIIDDVDRQMADGWSYVKSRSSRPRSYSTSRMVRVPKHGNGNTNVIVQQTVGSPYHRSRSRSHSRGRRASIVDLSSTTASLSSVYTAETPVRVVRSRRPSPRLVLSHSRSRSRSRTRFTQVIEDDGEYIRYRPAYDPEPYPWDIAPPSYVRTRYRSPSPTRVVYDMAPADPGYAYVTESEAPVYSSRYDADEAQREALRDRLDELAERPRVRFVPEEVRCVSPSPRRGRVRHVDIEYSEPSSSASYYYPRRSPSPRVVYESPRRLISVSPHRHSCRRLIVRNRVEVEDDIWSGSSNYSGGTVLRRLPRSRSRSYYSVSPSRRRKVYVRSVSPSIGRTYTTYSGSSAYYRSPSPSTIRLSRRSRLSRSPRSRTVYVG